MPLLVISFASELWWFGVKENVYIVAFIRSQSEEMQQAIESRRMAYHAPIEEYRVRAQVNVVSVGKKASDALFEAGKKITGTACIVGSLACIYKTSEDRNISWLFLAGLLGFIGSHLILH